MRTAAAARRLGMTKMRLYYEVRLGRIGAEKRGRYWYFSEREVAAYRAREDRR